MNDLPITQSSLSLLGYIGNIDGDHIITKIKRNDSGEITGVKTAPSTFYHRTVAWLSGSNRHVAKAIRDDLTTEYGERAASYALSEEEYDRVASGGINIKNAKSIYKSAEDPENLWLSESNRHVAKAVRDDLTTEYGKGAASYALSKEKYDGVAPRDTKIKNAKDICYDDREDFNTSLLMCLKDLKADEDHIITKIKRDKSRKITGVKTAPSTFYHRTVAWLSGSNRYVAKAIRDDLKAECGKEFASFAFSKEEYDKVVSGGINIKKAKSIYEPAQGLRHLDIFLRTSISED